MPERSVNPLPTGVCPVCKRRAIVVFDRDGYGAPRTEGTPRMGMHAGGRWGRWCPGVDDEPMPGTVQKAAP